MDIDGCQGCQSSTDVVASQNALDPPKRQGKICIQRTVILLHHAIGMDDSMCHECTSRSSPFGTPERCSAQRPPQQASAPRSLEVCGTPARPHPAPLCAPEATHYQFVHKSTAATLQPTLLMEQ